MRFQNSFQIFWQSTILEFNFWNHSEEIWEEFHSNEVLKVKMKFNHNSFLFSLESSILFFAFLSSLFLCISFERLSRDAKKARDLSHSSKEISYLFSFGFLIFLIQSFIVRDFISFFKEISILGSQRHVSFLVALSLCF